MAAEIALVTAAITAASAGVDLIDKIYWQVKCVVEGIPTTTEDRGRVRK